MKPIEGCDACDHGFVTDAVLGSAEIVRPCAVCMPQQYELWRGGQFEPVEENYPQGRKPGKRAKPAEPRSAPRPLPLEPARADLG